MLYEVITLLDGFTLLDGLEDVVVSGLHTDCNSLATRPFHQMAQFRVESVGADSVVRVPAA